MPAFSLVTVLTVVALLADGFKHPSYHVRSNCTRKRVERRGLVWLRPTACVASLAARGAPCLSVGRLRRFGAPLRMIRPSEGRRQTLSVRPRPDMLPLFVFDAGADEFRQARVQPFATLHYNPGSTRCLFDFRTVRAARPFRRMAPSLPL